MNCDGFAHQAVSLRKTYQDETTRMRIMGRQLRKYVFSVFYKVVDLFFRFGEIEKKESYLFLFEHIFHMSDWKNNKMIIWEMEFSEQ